MELNETILHSNLAATEGGKEMSAMLLEKEGELELATKKAVEAQEELENQLMAKSASIDLLRSELQQANEQRNSSEKAAFDAIHELNQLKSDFVLQETELNRLRSELKNSKDENQRLKKQVEGKSGDESNACVKISKEEFEALFKKAEKADRVIDPVLAANGKELEIVKKKLEIAMARIGELRTRAEQAASRAHAAEKTKAGLEDQIRKWQELRKRRRAALAALREESIPREISCSSFSCEQSPEACQPLLGEVLNMNFQSHEFSSAQESSQSSPLLCSPTHS